MHNKVCRGEQAVGTASISLLQSTLCRHAFLSLTKRLRRVSAPQTVLSRSAMSQLLSQWRAQALHRLKLQLALFALSNLRARHFSASQIAY